MMRIDISKTLEPYQTDKVIDFVMLLSRHAECNQTALGVRTGDHLTANAKFARARKIESGDQAKKRRLAARTGTNNGNELAGGDRKRDAIQCQRALIRPILRSEILSYVGDVQRRAFLSNAADECCYHFITPFCQASTRSRSLNKAVIMVEKKAAIISSAA